MTGKIPALTAQQAREAYAKDKIARLTKANQSITRKALTLLTVPDALPNDEGFDDNLIPVEAMAAPLKVELASGWTGYPAILKIYLDGDKEKPLLEQTYTSAPTFPLVTHVPQSAFQGDKLYSLKYLISTEADDQESDETIFTVNKDNPTFGNPGPAITFQTDHVTPEYLDDNSGLPFTIAQLINARAGDVCHIYIKGTNSLTPKKVYSTPPRIPVNPPDGTAGTIPKSEFYNEEGDSIFADGPLEVTYVAVSRAGYEAQPSTPTTLQLVLLPAPANLQPAEVPFAADTEELIDRKDASLGVTVLIKAYDNPTPDDNISVYWGDTRIGGVINLGPELNFPLETDEVKYSDLVAQGDHAEDGELGPKNVDITWKIERHGAEYKVDQPTTVSVDLRIPGPENPDPGPENPKLGKVTVTGGGVPPVANKIRVEDIDKDVTVTLPLFEGSTAGDVLEVVWNGVPTGETHTIVGDESLYTLTLPFSIVKNAGDNPRLPVQMRLIAGDDTIPGDNIPITYAQEVEVNTFVIGALTPPTIPDKHPTFNSIGCRERIWEGARIAIAGDAVNFATDDTVTVHWEGHASESDTTVIEGSKGNEAHKLVGNEASQGFEIRIAFDPYLMMVGDVADAPMRVWYELAKTSGQKGESTKNWFRPSYVKPDGCKCTSEDACATPAFKAKH